MSRSDYTISARYQPNREDTGRLMGSETINEHRTWQSIIPSCVVSHNGRQPTPQWGRHDRKTSIFDFFVYPHNSLSIVVVSGERFLARDVTHVNWQWWLEKRVVCHVSLPQHGKNLWLFNRLTWHFGHFNRQKYPVVWPRHKTCNISHQQTCMLTAHSHLHV